MLLRAPATCPRGVGKGAATRRVVDDLALARVLYMCCWGSGPPVPRPTPVPGPPGAPTGAQGPGKGAATRRVVDDRALERARRPRVAPARDRAARYDGRRAFGGDPALAHAPGGSPGGPWTLRGPRRKKKKKGKKKVT